MAYRYSQPNPPPRSRRGWLAVAIVAVLVGVAVSLVVRGVGRGPGSGLSDGAPGTAGAEPTPTAAPSDVPAVNSSPPSPPPNAPTADGASAFVRYWFATLNFATTTGDLAPLQAASGSGCQACTALTALVRDAYRDGRTLRGGQYTVREVLADSFFSPARPVLSVVFDRSPRSSIGPDGQLIEVVPGTNFASCQVVLELAADKWSVRDVLCDTPLHQ